MNLAFLLFNSRAPHEAGKRLCRQVGGRWWARIHYGIQLIRDEYCIKSTNNLESFMYCKTGWKTQTTVTPGISSVYRYMFHTYSKNIDSNYRKSWNILLSPHYSNHIFMVHVAFSWCVSVHESLSFLRWVCSAVRCETPSARVWIPAAVSPLESVTY